MIFIWEQGVVLISKEGDVIYLHQWTDAYDTLDLKAIPRKTVSELYDSAMQSGPGGIDLNPARDVMQVKKDGADFKFEFNGQTIDAAQVTGATFTIRTMTPVTNLPEMLGLNLGPPTKPDKPQELLAKA
jgi:hypothetical protein